jgi:hypothetical protein
MMATLVRSAPPASVPTHLPYGQDKLKNRGEEGKKQRHEKIKRENVKRKRMFGEKGNEKKEIKEIKEIKSWSNPFS